VQRRWPSVQKAEVLLGWRARIGVRDGVRLTAAWLREQEGATTP
jgi:nucleoside-diphosphate-sugar epimerase